MMKYLFLNTLMALSLSLNSQDLTQLYDQVEQAVVVIYTEENVLSPIGDSRKVQSKGLGSGFMVSDTQLVTAAHVVNVAERIMVKFSDGENIPGKVISSYNSSDVALVQLVWPKKNAVTVKLGNSDLVKTGQQVFIIGAPLGLGYSLSSGYISGRKDDKKSENPLSTAEFLQTDAAINSGNSGGPMFNLEGEVVGIVSSILSKSGGFEGIGFAATSNIAQDLLFDKKILWSGIDVVPLSGKLSNIFNVPQDDGLLVQRVVVGSPLDIMGIRSGDLEIDIQGRKLIVGGDILLSINGITFDLSSESTLKTIADQLIELKEDDPLKITVLRAGKIIELQRD